ESMTSPLPTTIRAFVIATSCASASAGPSTAAAAASERRATIASSAPVCITIPPCEALSVRALGAGRESRSGELLGDVCRDVADLLRRQRARERRHRIAPFAHDLDDEARGPRGRERDAAAVAAFTAL